MVGLVVPTFTCSFVIHLVSFLCSMWPVGPHVQHVRKTCTSPGNISTCPGMVYAKISPWDLIQLSFSVLVCFVYRLVLARKCHSSMLTDRCSAWCTVSRSSAVEVELKIKLGRCSTCVTYASLKCSHAGIDRNLYVASQRTACRHISTFV